MFFWNTGCQSLPITLLRSKKRWTSLLLFQDQTKIQTQKILLCFSGIQAHFGATGLMPRILIFLHQFFQVCIVVKLLNKLPTEGFFHLVKYS